MLTPSIRLNGSTADASPPLPVLCMASAGHSFTMLIIPTSLCAGSGVIEDDSEDDHPHLVVLGDVPLEVVRRILQALDPLSLAAAACVCR